MSKELIAQNKIGALEKILAHGDLSPMDQEQRLTYMKTVCKTLGISMLGKPFDFIKLNGKLVMYANASCAAQLRALHNISLKVISKERVDGLYVVTVDAVTGKGRTDSAIGAINIKGLHGQALADALMKCETKAKRRATLSLCGLNMLDEISAKDVAEREAKVAKEVAIESTSQKLDQTVGKPDFETERPAQSIEPDAPPDDAPPLEYTLKSMKGAKGKRLSQVPLKNLVKFMQYFNEAMERGTPMHPDVQDDAFHISAFLTEAATAQPQVPNE
jgi:hypothetical protein